MLPNRQPATRTRLICAPVQTDFIPWGNAYYAAVTGNTTYDRGPGMTDWLTKCGMGVTSPPEGCFSGTILCQHGENECKSNLIEGCVKDALKDSAADYWPFVHCFEGQDIDRVNPDSPIKALDACVSETGLSASTVAAVKSCMESPTASQAVLSKNAALTAALVPAHEGTPWLLVDGKSFSGVHYGYVTQTLHRRYTDATQTLHRRYTDATQTLHRRYTHATLTRHTRHTAPASHLPPPTSPPPTAHFSPPAPRLPKPKT